MHSRDATVLIDLLWFNVAHYSSLFQYFFTIYYGPYSSWKFIIFSVLVLYGLLTWLMILVYWNLCKIELHVGSRVFWDASVNKWSKSSVTCVNELGWPSLKDRWNCICIWTLYCIYHKRTMQPLIFLSTFILTQHLNFKSSVFYH